MKRDSELSRLNRRASLMFLVIMLFLLKPSSGSEWTYADTKTWSQLHIANNMCDGSGQTPVRLWDKGSAYNSALTPFYFTYLRDGKEVPFKPSLQETVDGLIWFNNGHTVGVNFPLNSNKFAVRVHFGSRYYRVAQLHWHWGANSSRGSEHTLNGRRFPLEAHLVAFDEKLYGNFATAAQSPKGLAVVGLFYHLVQEKEGLPIMYALTYPLENPKYQRVPKGSEKVEKRLIPLPILKIFQHHTKEYFRYLGSLTTPPCTENVLWTVARSSASITEKQLRRLRRAHFLDKSDAIMQDNFRVLQDLNPTRADLAPRRVMKSFLN